MDNTEEQITCKQCQNVIPDEELAFCVIPYTEGDGWFCQRCAHDNGFNYIDGEPIPQPG